MQTLLLLLLLPLVLSLSKRPWPVQREAPPQATSTLRRWEDQDHRAWVQLEQQQLACAHQSLTTTTMTTTETWPPPLHERRLLRVGRRTTHPHLALPQRQFQPRGQSEMTRAQPQDLLRHPCVAARP